MRWRSCTIYWRSRGTQSCAARRIHRGGSSDRQLFGSSVPAAAAWYTHGGGRGMGGTPCAGVGERCCSHTPTTHRTTTSLVQIHWPCYRNRSGATFLHTEIRVFVQHFYTEIGYEKYRPSVISFLLSRKSTNTFFRFRPSFFLLVLWSFSSFKVHFKVSFSVAQRVFVFISDCVCARAVTATRGIGCTVRQITRNKFIYPARGSVSLRFQSAFTR